MALSKEQLIAPRYKVIADYPKSLYPVGTIIRADGQSEDLLYCDWEGPRCRDYPHLFRKLEWWEERVVSEMPKYVKFKSKFVVEVSRYGVGTDSKKMYAVFDYKGKCMARPLKTLLPSDESEYQLSKIPSNEHS